MLKGLDGRRKAGLLISSQSTALLSWSALALFGCRDAALVAEPTLDLRFLLQTETLQMEPLFWALLDCQQR